MKWDMILFGDFVSERCHSVQPAGNIVKSNNNVHSPEALNSHYSKGGISLDLSYCLSNY